jgi:hypothetical protein
MQKKLCNNYNRCIHLKPFSSSLMLLKSKLGCLSLASWDIFAKDKHSSLFQESISNAKKLCNNNNKCRHLNLFIRHWCYCKISLSVCHWHIDTHLPRMNIMAYSERVSVTKKTYYNNNRCRHSNLFSSSLMLLKSKLECLSLAHWYVFTKDKHSSLFWENTSNEKAL